MKIGTMMTTMISKNMKKLLLLITFLVTINTFVFAQIPTAIPNSFIQDHAQVLNESDEKEIDTKLREFKTKYDLEFGVALVPSLDGRPINEYSLEMARTYGIGTKDNEKRGLLLLLAINDRKARFEISRHMETLLTDGESGEIQRKFLVPKLKIASKENTSAAWKDAIMTTLSATDNSIAKRNEPEVKSVNAASTNGKDLAINLVLGAFLLGLLGGLIWGIYRWRIIRNEQDRQERLRQLNEESRIEQQRRRKAHEAYLRSPEGIAETKRKEEKARVEKLEREKMQREMALRQQEQERQYAIWAKTPEGKAKIKQDTEEAERKQKTESKIKTR